MSRRCQIVLGGVFGDEAKGMMTDYLCGKFFNGARSASWDKTTPLVVRFSGGHQAGHGVNYNGHRHIFSQFGSGTLRNVPTYYSKYCTFYPTGATREYHALINLGVTPMLYVDAMAPVTTPYDLFYNRALESSRNKGRHGSCGVGFGATIQRHESAYKLHVQDLQFPEVLKLKLNAIKKYYDNHILWHNEDAKKYFYENDFDRAVEVFIESVEQCLIFMDIVHEEEFFRTQKQRFDTVIFEGSQGILLDMDFGFFPHVTRSNTTSKNAIEIINRNGLHEGRTDPPEIYYMTRAYQTRHGEGSMSDKHSELLKLKENPHETNVKNDWQGNFRKGLLDIDLLNYALACDNNFSSGLTKHLVVTCVDQIEDKWMALKDGEPIELLLGKDIGEHLNIDMQSILESHSDSPSHLKAFYNNGRKQYL